MFKTLKQKTLSRMITSALEANIHAQIMIDFYESELEAFPETDEKKKGQIELKISQLRDSIIFNERFIDFCKIQ